jgi:hypothetical protein
MLAEHECDTSRPIWTPHFDGLRTTVPRSGKTFSPRRMSRFATTTTPFPSTYAKRTRPGQRRSLIPFFSRTCIRLQDNMKSAINMADFQARFDKSTAQAQEMKEGALRVL